MRQIILSILISCCLPALAQQQVYPMQRDSIAARIADLQAIHTPNGIDLMEEVSINGTKQWISIRGLNKDNPILLVVHGGPGSAMMGMSWAYQKPWEDFFTVVNWEQRGVGKNYRATDTAALASSMTEAQHLQDAAVLIPYLLKKLNQPKLVLLGYSWGTKFTTKLVQDYPNWFYAWVGMGVVSPNTNAEAYLYNRVLEMAKAANNTSAIQELEALAPYPDPSGFKMRKALAVRKWVRFYNGGWYGKKNLDLFFSLHEWSPYYTSAEAALVNDATSWAGPLITRSFQQNTNTQFSIPVVFLMGKHDLQTPYAAALQYYARINAPVKKFISFENSAHMLFMEEPGKMLLTLVNEVLPLTKR